MDLTDLQTLQSELLSGDLDNFAGETPSGSAQTLQINWALRYISRRLVLVGYQIGLTLIASQINYDIEDVTTPVVTQRVIQPFHVVINGVPLSDRFARDFGLWSLSELQRQYPTYRGDASGTPKLACWLGRNGARGLLIYPAPSAGVVSGGHNYIAGQCEAPDLVNGTDVPQIPYDCHEAVAALAAIYAAIPTISAVEAWSRLEQMGRYHEPVAAVRAINLQNVMQYRGSDARFPLLLDEMEQEGGKQ
jgi:hypothetical protein